MHNIVKRSMEWGGRTLTLETGKLAQLANAAVTVQYGDTVVLATATMSGNIREGLDYFPLTVDYEENLFAAGKIKGSRFVKREGRPTDQAIINARITDRSVRPLFDYTIRNDVQIILNVLSVDQVNDPAPLGLIAASAALSISDIPWDGPIAGVGVALIDGVYVLNPNPEQRAQAQLYMMVATRDGQIVMIEAEGKEAAEDATLKGLEFAMEQTKPVLALILDLQKEVGKQKITPTTKRLTPEEQTMYDAVTAQAKEYIAKNIESCFGITGKADRMKKEEEVQAGLSALFTAEEEQAVAKKVFEEFYEQEFRTLMLEKEIRVDGRKLDEVRPLFAEVDVLPRTHGSAIFQRGETQALTTITLGAPGDAQIIDGIEPEYKKRYMHHYNFPPFSVGETKPLRGPSRRDIGHGMLAEKALQAMIPPKEEFPYTIRVVSSIMMSNGSSSQASACGSSLALMAAGVPLKQPVAGIAMGLVTNEDRTHYKILTDIQGIEDHSGDMDFKVAGTVNGVTAIQLDIKLGGITLDICRDTLTNARAARLKILEVMKAAIAEPRKEMSPYAPRIEILHIDPERIGELIGPGGKVINSIIDETDVNIDIEDDGTVFITATKPENMEQAKAMITSIMKVVEVGEIFEGTVTQIIKDRNSGGEIGAIVDLGGDKDGMIHISNVCHGRIDTVSSVLSLGDLVKVKVMEVDREKGRIGLSRKALIEPGMDDPKCAAAVASCRSNGGGRNDRPQRPFRKPFNSRRSD